MPRQVSPLAVEPRDWFAMDWLLKVCAVCACLYAHTIATPPPGYVKQPDTDKHPPKYEFGYDLKDGYGGSQGHLETRDGEFALGKYYVNLPNNEQKVDYFADDWGFHPLVEYKTSSASSSMSTQFALGEKAVAALSRQYGVAPPLEILKTKVAQSLVAGGGPHVSIQGSSGLIPGPSDEPVHNSLEGESYSSTTPSPPTTRYSVTPSSQSYENIPALNIQQGGTLNVQFGGVDISTGSPSAYTSQTTGGISTTQRYPSSGSEDLGSYRDQFESHRQSSSSGSSGYSSTENYPVSGADHEDSSQENYQSQKQNLYYENASGSTGYSSTASPISTSSRESGYNIASSPATSAQESYGHSESSTLSSEHAEHQVTSYLADTNAAVDVTGKGFPQTLPGIRDYSPNTRISAVLVGEGENHFEENEIRHDYVSSTTASPPKSVFRPIVVTDSNDHLSSVSDFSVYGGSSTEKYHTNKLGKLYHREGRVKTHEGYSTPQPDVKVTTVASKEYGYYSTPSPTPEPVLVTPRVHPSLLTSSGNILAPIQAGVSISNHHQEEECDEKPVVEGNNDYVSEAPEIEKQELRVEAVYKTTVDIQKSIPFEIHPNEEVSQEQNNQGSLDQFSQGEYSGSNQEQYHKETVNDSQEGYKQHSSEDYVQYNQSPQIGGSGEYSQSQETGYQTQENNDAVPYPHQTYQREESEERQAQTGHSENQHNQNNFLQQVVYAYHRLANNQPNQEVPNNPSYAVNIPVYNRPLFVPNRLYYVYLQRYNPYVNRYGSQSPVYTNYQPTITPTSVPHHPSDLYGYNGPNSGHGLVQNGQSYTQGYQGDDKYNANGNVGYAAYVNHEQNRHNGLYEPLNSVNSHNLYVHSSKENQVGETRYSSQSVNTELPHVVTGQQVNLHAGVENVHSVSPTPYSTPVNYEASNHVAQEYAAQLNALSTSGRGSSDVHPDNQHVQYSSTAQGAESAALTQENYNQQEQAQYQHQSDANVQEPQDKFVEEASNDVHHNANVLIKEVPVPQYIERTKLVEVEKPIHIPHPIPVEYTRVVERPVPVPHPVPVTQTQIVEKHVPVPQPVPVEVTRVVEKHVPVPHPVPVEYTKVVAVEKPVPVPQPYAVTKLVAVDRPVAYPQPVPLPYAVPHPVGVPVPHLVPYPQVVPVPVKDYHPVYLYRKSTGGRLLHREPHQSKSSSQAFRPSQPVFTSQYPPPSYQVTAYFKAPHSKSRGHARKLCIEYGGFKPPLVPSIQVDEEHKPTYGPPSEQNH